MKHKMMTTEADDNSRRRAAFVAMVLFEHGNLTEDINIIRFPRSFIKMIEGYRLGVHTLYNNFP
jgi:hypothetical protein